MGMQTQTPLWHFGLGGLLVGFGAQLGNGMGGAVGVTVVVYHWAPRLLRRPVVGAHFAVRTATWDRDTLVVFSLFGVGWGVGCATFA